VDAARNVRDVKEEIRRLVDERGSISNSEAAKVLHLSRQAIHKHLDAMTASGELERTGAGRAVRYARCFAWTRTYSTRGLDEAIVWEDLRASIEELAPIGDTTESVMQYVVTEMVNNAIDHSESDTVQLRMRLDGDYVALDIVDGGVGVFARIVDGTDIDRELEAAQQLTLGKVTTWPERHTGEGIFFSSRAVQVFRIEANGIRLTFDNEREDWAIGSEPSQRGSTIHVEVNPDRVEPIVTVFNRFAETDRGFDTTSTVVRLFETGVRFVSRSEAKRLAPGLEPFRRAILDFAGVTEVGQGFVDELFRVWAGAHPDTTLEPINASDAVQFMIDRGRAQS
jgi:anti-sigma regulatory factor (Ser/Thr protein kinase)